MPNSQYVIFDKEELENHEDLTKSYIGAYYKPFIWYWWKVFFNCNTENEESQKQESINKRIQGYDLYEIAKIFYIENTCIL